MWKVIRPSVAPIAEPQYVAQEMHAQDNAGGGDQRGSGEQADLQLRVKHSQRRGYTERSDEWPDGNEYLSGGKIAAQQCGSISQGLLRWLACLSMRKRQIPAKAAEAPR